MKSFKHWIRKLTLVMLTVSSLGVSHARDIIKVGIHHNPPKIFIDTNGNPSGILGELIREIADRELWQIQAVPCEWQDCLDALASGQIDLLPDVALTPERAEVLSFHDVPSHHSWSQLFARPGVQVASFLDLAGIRIAVLEGSVQQQYLRSALEGFGLDAHLIPFKSFEDALTALNLTEADLLATNHHFGAVASQRTSIVPTNILFDPAQLYFAAPKDQNRDLLAAIDRHLHAWRSDPGSFYYSNLNRWAGGTIIESIPASVRWIFIGAFALLSMSLLLGLVQQRILRQRTAQIRATEAKYEAILNSLDAAVFIKDKSLAYSYVNNNACKMLGLTSDRILGHTDAELFDPNTARHLSESDTDLLTEKQRFISREETLKRADNTPMSVFTVKMPLLDEHGKPYAVYGVATDMTRERETEQRIKTLGLFDDLTGLPNRSAFLDNFQKQLASSAAASSSGGVSLGLLLIDLDNFKSLNDTRGHAYGDLLLIQVARRLQSIDPLAHHAARLSGDTFALLIKASHASDAITHSHLRDVIERIQEVIGQPFELNEIIYRTRMSIGATITEGHEISAQRALRHAELALYEAKSAGTGEVRLFELWMEQAATRRSELEHELRCAIENREFQVFYQVQVDESLEPTSVEALVRWQHPTRGLIQPGEFIGFAESNGMIIEIGEQVLEIACRQIRQWQESPQTRHLIIAVNVSARQLYDPRFLQRLQRAVSASAANPALLEIEITESHLIADIQAAIQTMQSVRAMGVRVSLDDFGTGFSSLSHLRTLPLDQLKIDQIFVRNLSVDAGDDAIVQTIIDLGKTLRLDVIAEGIETWAQHDKLRQMGCKRYQGYLFGRPCSVDQLDLAPRKQRKKDSVNESDHPGPSPSSH